MRSLIESKKGLAKPLYYLYFILILISVFRSLIHIFALDGGAHSIATFIRFVGEPDPNIVIHYMFGLWGISQLLLALVMLIIPWVYPQLMRFMYVVLWLEYALRFGFSQWIKPLDPLYFTGTAPGGVGNVVLFFGLGALLLYWFSSALYDRLSKRC